MSRRRPAALARLGLPRGGMTDTFYCPDCDRGVPFDCGAADEAPDQCDDCWARERGAESMAAYHEGLRRRAVERQRAEENV